VAPDGDIGPLDQAAIQMHELFLSLRRAGFSRSESISIIAKTAAEAMNQATDNEGDDAGHG
jgi:hypothetical protein